MKLINRIIEYCFYALFLVVPLLFTGDTSELFELNKMWFTWGVTIIIGAAWISKMIIQKKIHIQKTLLDIPLLLFLASQIISTVISLDSQVSWWGYYSRFNGGLLSTIAYVFLYYAFVSNLGVKHVLRSLVVSLVAGLLTALWGFPAHFGYDPTCLVFRGTLDTTCWTDAFKPTVRTFSSLGQPEWFAAYLVLLIPIAMTLMMKYDWKNAQIQKNPYLYWTFFFLTMFLYVNLLFANTRAGYIAFLFSYIFFWFFVWFGQLTKIQKMITSAIFIAVNGILLFTTYKSDYGLLSLSIVGFLVFLVALLLFNRMYLFLKSFLILTAGFLFITLIIGMTWTTPLGKITLFSPPPQSQQQAPVAAATKTTTQTTTPAAPVGDGITDSGDIRKYVWEGAITAWKANPLIGTGVETYAFAYYKYKPAGQNLTSEWDYLYNKAHNEYLNYLATTGFLGLGTYLAFLVLFLFISSVWLLKKQTHETHEHLSYMYRFLLITGLVVGFLTILLTNFFGFSVVIMNLYLFLIPAFVLIILDRIDQDKAVLISFSDSSRKTIGAGQWTVITIVVIIAGYLSYQLFAYRNADIAYALGSNYDKVGAYDKAFPLLQQAVAAEPTEPVYTDEYAIDLATLASAMQQKKELAQQAEQLRNQALAYSDQLTTNHPNNVTYWKNRVRIFYTLAQTDPTNAGAYLTQAEAAIQQAAQLAPNDAKILYNLGVLYGQTGNLTEGITTLEKTITLKPDYRDAYYALGLFYHQEAIDTNNKVIHPEIQQKAVDMYTFVLEHINPNDKQIQDTLKLWQK